MTVRFFKHLNFILSLIHIVKTDFDPRNKFANFTFKDYLEKFKPSIIWREIEDNNKLKGINRTLKDEFENVYKRIDESDTLLNLKVKNGDPKIILRKDGRRWKPPGDIVPNKYDRFSLRRRILELMKQTIYQARNKMVIMQVLREKYSSISVYKMGFLISKTDTACKTFARFAYKAFRACTLTRQGAITTYPLIDQLEAIERLLDLWFDVELLVDLININNENCKRMLNQVMTNRKHAWKFVD
ncbi:uncharacterized protein LOC124536497 [Vanessa cardui]|uniref:uncharacterized protein LOC124536497 n=1 Tax=Vanessa cardui TaxID=171605 RepID=UPI001F1388CD|nr:uncharacterized protein LOC124536497 [Vanessa cardui]